MDPNAIYIDHGFTCTQRERPCLGKALAACQNEDTLVVTKLDRLTRPLPDARNIPDELTRKGVALKLGGSIHDPHAPWENCCSTKVTHCAEDFGHSLSTPGCTNPATAEISMQSASDNDSHPRPSNDLVPGGTPPWSAARNSASARIAFLSSPRWTDSLAP